MKRKFWIPSLVLGSVLTLVACIKNDDTVQCTPNTTAQDQHVIDSFLNATGQDAYISYNSTYGAYYGITNPGSGQTAASDSIVAFKRTISTFSGSAEVTLGTDSLSQSASNGTYLHYSDFSNDVALKHFLDNAGVGGKLRIIYPSNTNVLGFWGCQQQSLTSGEVIPAYSQVVIDYELTGVKYGN